ncbi:tyrosine-type recombinase/integrase [Brevibacterium moorei]|uniref:tyrosine-type recombinase/integrase n=1 Tax=Brevibacterium moorei TaxID=2968457 RepID=UPI00211BFB55|nr:tyrosine-type recombinase/integrase [Brevibacterium sp. 68QC2CO]MCQ9384403.1 tyrosine-type recombinase/integrase [Brevibacterium sp. 68QC2CO]
MDDFTGHAERFLTAYPNHYEYRRILKHWAHWCAGRGLDPLAVSTLDIEAWSAEERARGCAPSTVGRALGCLRSFYAWAYRSRVTADDPGAHVRVHRRLPVTGRDWLSAGELTAWLDTARDADSMVYAAGCMFALNGLRRGDALQSQLEDVTVTAGVPVIVLPGRKASRADRLALAPRTVAAIRLHAQGRDEGPILMGLRGPVTVDELYSRMDVVTRAAGTGRTVRPHMLRHTFVTLSQEAGISARDTAASAGWVSTAPLSTYDRGWRSVKNGAAPRLDAWLETLVDHPA